jgi:hypothetical protein
MRCLFILRHGGILEAANEAVFMYPNIERAKKKLYPLRLPHSILKNY